MSRTFIRQDAQIAQSFSYDDTRAPTEANYETNATDIEYDLNSLRSALQSALNRTGDGMPSGNWWDNVVKPSALETGARRGVSALNDALHLVEKKRVLRSVASVTDIVPGTDLAILLVNDLKAMYEAHRILTTGGVHGAADNTNAVTAADANSLASAITLANDIKAQYNAHRQLTAGGVHGAADNTNVVSSADATVLADLITLINEIRTDYEAHRVLTSGSVHGAADNTNAVTEAAVGSTTDVHILTAAQLPTQTTAAIGAVTTLGTVLAHATAFGTASTTDVVSGSFILAPKNIVELVHGETRDPIVDGSDRRVWGLFQSESNTDGSTLSGDTPDRAQISFVVVNSTGDGWELYDMPVGTVFNIATVERVRLEDLNEQDFLRGAVVDVPAGATVTRQVAYDNQGVTPVELGNNAYLDLGTGLEWQVRDNVNAILFRIIEGSGGGTSKVAIEDDTDEFDIDAVVSDFLNGIKVDTGAAGTTIQIGVTANQIDSGGALTIATGASGDLKLDSVAGEILFDDVNRTGSTWSATSIKLSETTAEWDDFETYFGEVSLMNAIVQASKKARRWKGYAKLTANVAADNNVTGVGGGANLDAALPSYDIPGLVFVDDVDVYLNGELLRNGADDSANHDVYPGTTAANGDLMFEFALKGTGSKPDQLCMVVYGS